MCVLNRPPVGPRVSRSHGTDKLVVSASTLDLFESTMGRRLGWKWRGHRLDLELLEPIYYEASGYDAQHAVIRFGHEHDPRARHHAPLALYRDVVTHEVTHAIIDGYRPHTADQEVASRRAAVFGHMHKPTSPG